MIVLWEKGSRNNAAEFVRTEPFPGSAGREVVVPGAETRSKLFYICLEEMGADVMNIAIRSIKGKRILCRPSG